MTTGIEKITFNGLPAVRITAPDGATATILNLGAHIVSWIPARGEERLYLSEKSEFKVGEAVRGGVPVCFPQFGGRGNLPKHGFARLVEWTEADSRVGDDFATATFTLTDNEETRKIWPHAFEVELTVLISGQRLDIELGVKNHGEDALSFTGALHTYLRMKEVEEARIEGLHGLHYLDATSGVERDETGVDLSIEAETDRIYFDADRPVLVREARRSLGIGKENFADVVVWNPWEKNSAAIADLPDNGFRHMLCIEAAAVNKPVELAPGAEWWGRQTIAAL